MPIVLVNKFTYHRPDGLARPLVKKKQFPKPSKNYFLLQKQVGIVK